MTLGLAEQHELVVRDPGRVPLPLEVRTALKLEAGDRFSIERLPLSLRLASVRELEAEWGAGTLPEAWCEEIARRPQTALEVDGALPIPSDLLSLARGGRLMLEVVAKGLSHELYLYRVED